jgi:hypothetical protein
METLAAVDGSYPTQRCDNYHLGGDGNEGKGVSDSVMGVEVYR